MTQVMIMIKLIDHDWLLREPLSILRKYKITVTLNNILIF